MRKALLFSAMLFFVLAVAGFQVSVDKTENIATIEDPAEISLEVENTGSSEENYRLSILDYYRSQWYRYSDSLEVPAGNNGSFNIEVHPDNTAVQGIYRANFVVRSSSGEEVRDSFSYRVTRDEGLNLIDVKKNESFRPGDQVNIGLVFRNVESSTSEYKDIEFKLFNESKNVELGPIVPGGERRISSSFTVPEYESPGQKDLVIAVNDRNYTDRVNIEEVKEIEENKTLDNMLLVVKQNIAVKNTGNVDYNYVYDIEKPAYISPVVSAQGAEVLDNDEGTTYRWNITLEPGETADLQARTDYWIPLTGLILLLAGFVALKKITSSVDVKKTVKKTDEGLDVTIEVENSSSRSYDDVLLEDFIPNIAGLHQKFDMADPEVKQTDEGAELRWWINDLQPGDQRIFRYSIKPKVEVEGGVELEPAILRNGDEVLGTTKEISAEFKPE